MWWPSPESPRTAADRQITAIRTEMAKLHHQQNVEQQVNWTLVGVRAIFGSIAAWVVLSAISPDPNVSVIGATIAGGFVGGISLLLEKRRINTDAAQMQVVTNRLIGTYWQHIEGLDPLCSNPLLSPSPRRTYI